jgi:hypothetical protein
MAERTISTADLRRIVNRGESEVGRFVSTRAGRARVRLVTPGGRTRDVEVVDARRS